MNERKEARGVLAFEHWGVRQQGKHRGGCEVAALHGGSGQGDSMPAVTLYTLGQS